MQAHYRAADDSQCAAGNAWNSIMYTNEPGDDDLHARKITSL